MHHPSFQHDPFITSAPAGRRAALPVEPPPPSGPRVLVIENEADLSESLSQVLAFDFDVTAVRSSAEALERLESGETYDVVLCDLAMPQMDGIALLERVRAFAPELAGSFLFVTSGTARTEGSEAVSALSPMLADRLVDIRALRGVAEWHFSHCFG